MSAGEGGAASVEDGRERVQRWGPYVLLAIASLLVVGTSVGQGSRAEWYAVGALVAAALVLQLWRHRNANRGPCASSTAYYCVRFVLAAALTSLSPFFCVYAVMGYFDSDELLPRRARYAGPILTAVIMSGAEAGGLPPTGLIGWIAFAGLFALNSSLIVVFGRLQWRQEETARERAATIAQLERAMEENAGLHAQLLVQAREAGINDERARLAAEIHDTIAQGLAGIVTQLQVALDDPDPAAARARVERAADLARQNLGEARRSVQALGPVALEHDALPVALRKSVEEWSAQAGVDAALTVTGTAEPLHAEVEATVLRIAQEALANVARHAEAGRVGVTLSYMDDEVTLDVRDDGRGFDTGTPPVPRGSGGFGLSGMRARAERLAGTLDVESEPGLGTAISARVPLVRHA